MFLTVSKSIYLPIILNAFPLRREFDMNMSTTLNMNMNMNMDIYMSVSVCLHSNSSAVVIYELTCSEFKNRPVK